MADDQERLVVLLEARIRDFEKNMQKASRTSGDNWKKIERDAKSSASRLESIYSGVGAGLRNAFGALGGAAGIGGLGFVGLTAFAKDAAGYFANIAAEAKRAGVGVEALQELGYAAQQSRVDFDALIDGLKEMQLRADEFIVTGAGGGAEAFQRLGYRADELKTKLAQPDALFEEIIGKLSTLDRASQIRIADELFGGTGGEQFVRLLSQGNGYIARMRQEARDTSNVLSSDLIAKAVEIDRQFNRLATTISTNVKAAVVELVALLKDFTSTFTTLVKVASGDAVAAAQRIAQLQASIQRAAAQFGAGSPTFNAVTGGMQKELAGLQAKFATASGPGGIGSDARSPLVSPPPSGGGSGDTSNIGRAKALADAYKQITEAARARIAALNVETQATGMAAREAERFRFEQEALAEAQRAGIKLNEAQRNAIGALASQYADASIAAQTAAESMERAAAAKQEFTSMGVDSVKGFVADLRAGVSTTDALTNGINRLADRLLDLALDSLVGMLFKNLAGAIGGPTLARLFGGFRAEGGDVRRGKAYVVGEKGPELFAPGASGRIIPNHSLRAPGAPAIGRAGSQNITVSPTINVSVEGGSRGPQADAELAQRIGSEIEGNVRGMVVKELAVQLRPGGILNQFGR